MKHIIGYKIQENNRFGNWSYKGVSPYYLAKEIEEYDNNTGEVIARYYEPLSDKFAYRDKILTFFRGKEVNIGVI